MKSLLISFLLFLCLTPAQASIKTIEVPTVQYWSSIDRCNLDILRMVREVLRASSRKGSNGLPSAKKMETLAASFRKDFAAFSKISPKDAALKPLHNSLWNTYSSIDVDALKMAKALKAGDKKRYQYFFYRLAFYIQDGSVVENQMEKIETRLHRRSFASPGKPGKKAP